MHLHKKTIFVSVSVTLLGLSWFYIVPPLNWPVDDQSATWIDSTAETIGNTGEWSNKVEVADINGDGLFDIVFANGGDYETPGQPEPARIFLNRGAGAHFVDASKSLFGEERYLARVIKVRDINNDGFVDLLVGTTYQSRSQLWLGNQVGQYINVTADHFPQQLLSVGDLDVGDVDADGDLDLVLADWGAGNPMENTGGVTRLWLNDGSGRFEDMTATRMPDQLVRFSWDLELVDVDNDTDLDILVSCKQCEHNFLYTNDGKGYFSDESDTRLPRLSNNYDFEAMDVDADGDLDLIAVNAGFAFSERLLLNDGKGYYTIANDAFSSGANPFFCDDNAAAYTDVDADSDADILIASLNCPDRLLINDGHAHFQMQTGVFAGQKTPGTLGIAVADLNGDRKPDVVQAQGETAFDDRVYLGKQVATDIVAPAIRILAASQGSQVVVRVHDHNSQNVPMQELRVELEWDEAGVRQHSPLQWYGEYLWRAVLPAGPRDYQLCAEDRAGNRRCFIFKAS